MGIGPNPVTAGYRYDFISESLVLDENFIDTDGLRGTRSRYIQNLRQGNRHVHGQIKMQPTALELSTLLPTLLQGTSTTVSGLQTIPLQDAVTAGGFWVVVDRISEIFNYSGCQPDKITVTGRSGEPLELTVDIVGVDEILSASGSFPSLSIDVTTVPFIFTDLVLSSTA